MGSVTIRNIPEEIKQAARLAGVRNGRSMEAELRALLERTYASATEDRGAWLRAMSGAEFVDHLIKVANGAELEIPELAIGKDIEFPDL
ncbi:FitA-like ribbon-helix-helix domain-containing protein [Sphingomonas sp.]|uniref:FitA-like ribbon-helix-helix domain-containing protein n=1 Tax=Sphingomonas sp. TaxID=28214 RepID=UPI002ED94573